MLCINSQIMSQKIMRHNSLSCNSRVIPEYIPQNAPDALQVERDEFSRSKTTFTFSNLLFRLGFRNKFPVYFQLKLLGCRFMNHKSKKVTKTMSKIACQSTILGGHHRARWLVYGFSFCNKFKVFCFNKPAFLCECINSS